MEDFNTKVLRLAEAEQKPEKPRGNKKSDESSSSQEVDFDPTVIEIDEMEVNAASTVF